MGIRGERMSQGSGAPPGPIRTIVPMRVPLFVRGDLDGFFGLFLDNLLQLMLIHVLCTSACGLSAEFVAGRILPGAALSILAGNAFYAWQARRLMRATGRTDVTALPYGINTPSLVAYALLVMAPVYRAHAGDGADPARAAEAAELAWRVGLFACLGSGVIELAGAFVGDWLRRVTPRAALLAALAGVGLTFISMGFVFQLFASPAVALVPTLLIVFAYAGRLRLPLGLPAGLAAILLGVGLAWGLRALGLPYWTPPATNAALALHWPEFALTELASLFASPLGWCFLAVIVPMGLFNVIGSLQNLESADAAGDRFETRPALLANGAGTVLAALLGSPFPTTLYIGHPGWKALGARAGYSALNGVVTALLCLFGGVTLVLCIVPLEAALGILLWIGIVITAQTFGASPVRHGIAAALGLLPALAAWALYLIEASLRAAGSSLAQASPALVAAGVYVPGIVALSQGFLLSSMLLAAIVAHVVDGRLRLAAAWCFVAAALSAVGLIHGHELGPEGVVGRFFDLRLGPESPNPAVVFACGYALGAAILLGLARRQPRGSGSGPGSSPSTRLGGS
jgi:AGZA family xanthine/uracil permease-like MFS transporter